MRLLMLPKNTTSKLHTALPPRAYPIVKGQISSLGKFLLCNKVSLYEALMIVWAAWNFDVEQFVALSAWRKSCIFGPPQAEGTEQEEDTYDTLPTSE